MIAILSRYLATSRDTKHNNTIMTSFVSLPYELQYHILQYALPLEEYRYDDWRFTGPMVTVRCTAANLVLALPMLRQHVARSAKSCQLSGSLILLKWTNNVVESPGTLCL